MKFSGLLAAAASATLASAHTIFVQLEVGGTTYPVAYGIRTPTYDGPITDVLSDSVACNGNPNPTRASIPPEAVIEVQAGSTIYAIWRHTLQSGPNDVLDSSHKGPSLAYLKPVSDATTASGVGGGWFKIQEDGYSNGVWGTEKVMVAPGRHAITIPDCLPDGEYLLRAELIALHAAGSYPGAQLYMECAQIRIVGGSGAMTGGPTVSFPGAYAGNDPGITFNLYTPNINYVIPGPEKFTCSGGGGGGGSPTTTMRTSTTSRTSTSTRPTTTPGGGGGGSCTVSKWGQCGGIGYSGCTTCASGSTCTVSNEYYSQCL